MTVTIKNYKNSIFNMLRKRNKLRTHFFNIAVVIFYEIQNLKREKYDQLKK